ncbi:MAG: hypothetical protein BGO43_00055 [Gammaproteobacteria bacterium 39-13]|nr:helix-turn-helix transcriptional regulator [Gammaproteobacteria bacterium]OJV96659.1 MAG: hypothetical protein BGO43_00055 [Gammaproteobacteria bacterium 39-13]
MKKLPPLLIKSLKRETSHEGKWHHHQSGQLFVIKQGLLILETKSGRSMMPSSCAGWLPTGHSHRAKTFGPLQGISFYLAPSLCAELPKQPCVFTTNELLNAIMDRMTTWPKNQIWSLEKEHLLQVMLDELKNLQPTPLYLPMPQNKRLEKIAHTFILDPTLSKTLEAWAKTAHMTKRTFTRHFRQETGLSFTKWCQQVRIMQSLEYLAKGKSVTWISLMLGYTSISAFIKIFRQFLGKTPTAYLSKR